MFAIPLGSARAVLIRKCERIPLVALALLAFCGASPARGAPNVVGLGYGEVPIPAFPGTLPDAVAYVYRDAKPEPVRLHVFRPQGWKAGDRRPALLWFFGGGWTTGRPSFSVPFARWAAGLGMVGIAADYRVADRYGTPPVAAVADGRKALRWVEDHSAELGIDPARIVVGGNSAGAHLALWTAIAHTPPGSDPADAPVSKPAALFLTSAPSDTSGFKLERSGAADLKALSPLHQLDSRMPPVIEFHGQNDAIVPVAQAIALNERLLATGNTSELVAVPDAGHNFVADNPPWGERTLAMAADFLRRQGILPAAAPAATGVDGLPVVVPREKQFDLISKINGAAYRIWVSAPPEARGRPCPVFYVLDGNWYFRAASDDATWGSGRLEPAIIVGIGYPTWDNGEVQKRRTLDFSLVSNPPVPIGIPCGGGEAFLRVLNEEIRPFVEARYRIDPLRQTLFGKSLAGSMVLHAMFCNPASFSTYVAASPAISFNRKVLEPEEAEFAARVRAGGVRAALLLTSAGDEQYQGNDPVQRALFGRFVDDVADLSGRLSALDPKAVRVTYAVFAGESHPSVSLASIARAIRFAIKPAPQSGP